MSYQNTHMGSTMGHDSTNFYAESRSRSMMSEMFIALGSMTYGNYVDYIFLCITLFLFVKLYLYIIHFFDKK